MLIASDLGERTPSYAIPSQRLRGLLDELADGAHPLDVGWLLRPLDRVNLAQEFQIFLSEKLEEAGFTPQEAAEHVRELDLPPGMYVLATEPKSPADDTNIFPGDMITKIDGEAVGSQAEVCKALEDAGNEAEVDGVAITSSTRIADIGEKFTVVLKIR
jgi:S1-C subfamily serine protease